MYKSRPIAIKLLIGTERQGNRLESDTFLKQERSNDELSVLTNKNKTNQKKIRLNSKCIQTIDIEGILVAMETIEVMSLGLIMIVVNMEGEVSTVVEIPPQDAGMTVLEPLVMTLIKEEEAQHLIRIK